MNDDFKQIIWKQFGASIDMLGNAIDACPDELWQAESNFWHRAFHTLFYLDYYLTLQPETFTPPAPFGLTEFDPAGKMPERVYTKQELLDYVSFCRNKCFDLINNLTPEIAAQRWVNAYRDYSVTELLLYNMRHVQHHLAQLNLILRQGNAKVPRWVSQAK